MDFIQYSNHLTDFALKVDYYFSSELLSLNFIKIRNHSPLYFLSFPHLTHPMNLHLAYDYLFYCEMDLIYYFNICCQDFYFYFLYQHSNHHHCYYYHSNYLNQLHLLCFDLAFSLINQFLLHHHRNYKYHHLFYYQMILFHFHFYLIIQFCFVDYLFQILIYLLLLICQVCLYWLSVYHLS